VTQIDPNSLVFEDLPVRTRGNGSLSCDCYDVNGDGYVDLVCRYQDALTEGRLIGRVLDGTGITGIGDFCIANQLREAIGY